MRRSGAGDIGVSATSHLSSLPVTRAVRKWQF